MATAVKSGKKSTPKKKMTVENLFSVQGDRPRFTGKRIITMNQDSPTSLMKSLSKKASLNIASIMDFSSDINNYYEAFSQGDGIYFDTFKIAVINDGNDDQVNFMNERNATAFESEPERFVYALPISAAIHVRNIVSAIFDNSNATWGIQAVKALMSSFTRKGVNIAVLDTGLNLKWGFSEE